MIIQQNLQLFSKIHNFLGGGPVFGSPGCYQNLSPGGGPLFRSLGCYQNLSLGMHIWQIFRNSMKIIIYSNIWDSKAKQGHSNTMPIHSNFIDKAGAAAEGRGPCSVHCIKMYGHGVGIMSLFGLGGQNNLINQYFA